MGKLLKLVVVIVVAIVIFFVFFFQKPAVGLEGFQFENIVVNPATGTPSSGELVMTFTIDNQNPLSVRIDSVEASIYLNGQFAGKTTQEVNQDITKYGVTNIEIRFTITDFPQGGLTDPTSVRVTGTCHLSKMILKYPYDFDQTKSIPMS
jgi:LEA14-like dessication related protein